MMSENRARESHTGLGSLPLLILLLVLPGQSPRAGNLDVLAGASSTGSFGLTVTLGQICIINDVVVPSPTVNSDQLACNTITAGNVQVTAPGSTFTAGDSITIQNGFSVAPGVAFTAAVDPFVKSSFAFVQDDGPSAVSSYNAAFDLNLDNLALTSADNIGLFNGYAANGDLLFRAVLRLSAGMTENRLALFAQDDNAGAMREHSVDFLLPAGFNNIQVFWQAGAGNGQFLVSVNGAPLSGLVDLNNSSRLIDSVRWGAVDGTMVASPGSMDLDNFESWRLALLPTETTIEPSNAVTNVFSARLFGWSLAIDGDTLVVGLPGDLGGLGPSTGAVFVFERIAGVWTQVQRIENPDTVDGSGDSFGLSVDVVVGPDPLDDFLIVGAPFSHVSERGIAYIFRRDNGLFVFETELPSPLGGIGDHFGRAVGIDLSVPVNSLTDDLFYTAVVGSPGADDPFGSTFSEGAVHVYQRVGAPPGWAFTHTFYGPIGGPEMGESVDIDGGLILAGAPRFATNLGAGFGFGRGNNLPAGDFAWGAGPRFDASDAQSFDFMGRNTNGVAVDFRFAVGLMGALPHDVGAAANAGAAYIFSLLSGMVGTVRNETQKLTASDPVAFARFGTAVGIDGTTAVVSAPGATAGVVLGGGAMYVFQRATNWLQVNKIFPSDVDANFSLFGHAVGIDGGTAVAGMPSNPSGKYPDGVVYIYETFPFIFADGFESGDTSAW